MKLRDVLLASAMIALPLAANAQAIDGLYVGLGAGVNLMQNENYNSSGGFGTAPGTAKPNAGPVVVVSLGWGFGNGIRAEIEGSYRSNDYDKSSFGGIVGNITEQKYGVMFNALYDFVDLVPVVQPYAGLGIGYQAQQLDASLTGNTISGSSTGSFAYQAILGAALPIDAVPGLSVTAEYRFMGLTGNRNFSGSAGGVAGSISSTENYNHSLLIGLRYAFGTPAPAAAPMPVADAGAKTFLVFFDWNKSDLTSRGSGIVKDAASYSTTTRYTRIDVDGNADTSGTPGYNQGLSERRAQVVAAELVRDGVPQNAISMHAYGDTKLLVPTGPNTREPQNRRVEIVFH